MELNPFANEFVNILSKELASTRAELLEAQSRNSAAPNGTYPCRDHEDKIRTLQNEIIQLKAQNEELQDLLHNRREESRESLVKQEPERDLVPQYIASINQMQQQLAEVLAEKESANEEYNRATSDFQDDIENLRSKYKNAKAEKEECQEVIEKLNSQLHKYSESEQDLEGKTSWRKECLPTTLLDDIKYGPIAGQPKLSANTPFCRSKSLQIPQLALSACTSDGILECDSNQVQWSRYRTALCVLLGPAFQYDPENPKRSWQKVKPILGMGQKKDIVYQDNSGWHYMGTYERVTPVYSISMDKMKSIKCLAKSKVTFNQIIPQRKLLSSTQQGILRDLCDSGILMFEFFGLKCVDYNEKLRDALANSFHQHARKKPAGKRKRAQGNDAGPKKKKKKKKK
ncbi:hypothetical protein BJ138DRAFT_1152864 [Hygrophoropsis aurantiaca]|uniref:Uncharacterized protein n=1 Tax=Hygrophoropsis aurantiaca TaxID=72124 RepID=A0ACB8ABL0_9AGAM|nr:hypothetical protein BJ138DRAFT_1152864 [Hygrophoropsis aurantiaca]